jgi:DNA (cytosine-5)-methyltransferase 1
MMSQLVLFEKEESQAESTFINICKTLSFENESGWPDKFGEACQKWTKSAISKPINTLSLFTGAGGLDIGFHDLGFNIHTQVEIEKDFAATLNANTGNGKYFDNNTNIICDDIRNFYPSPDLEVDLIIGGPPCQTFSAAGRRASGVLGTSDARGMLFKEYVRLLKTLSPKAFLFENVYGIIGAQNGEAWKNICDAFLSAGYHLFYRVIDASEYGVPQHRERLFIVGVKDGSFLFPKPTHGPDSQGVNSYYTPGQALLSIDSSSENIVNELGGSYGHLLKDIPPGLNYSFYTEEMGHPNPVFAWRSKFSDFLYKADPDMPIRTLKAQGGKYTGPFHWENRPFSINELKRLQTFPDKYVLTGSKQTQIKQIGNSVPPQISRILAINILHQIFNIDIPFDMPLLMPQEELKFRQRKRNLTDVYRKKAQNAIIKLYDNPKLKLSNSRKYYAKLTSNFEIIQTEDLDESFLITCEQNRNEWIICAKDNVQSQNYAFEIEITPLIKNKWNLNVDKVFLKSTINTFNAYTILWKAFEKELIDNNYKADLIQLFGYYQYNPIFKIQMNLNNTLGLDKNWRILELVTSGRYCKINLSQEYLALNWETNSNEILDTALFLRSLGYEVRNHKTNPQLPKGFYLIPYPFPTLTKNSVQLRKTLI